MDRSLDVNELSPFLCLWNPHFMQHPPASFVEKLDSEFRGRLRVRWSNQRHGWLIEQKVKRGLFPGTKPTRKGWDESSDRYAQHRDGYVELMEVRTGTLMECPKCKSELKVPYGFTEVIRCSFCRLRGKEPHIAAVFLPLGDELIDYLKKIDPMNPISERLAEDLDRQNAALDAAREQDAANAAVAGMEQDYRRVAGIPQVGLTGKTKFWKR